MKKILKNIVKSLVVVAMIISYVSINVRAIETNDDIMEIHLELLMVIKQVIGMVVYIQVNYW